MSRREFQLVEGTSRKFWAIELDGKAHTVRFGRIGTTGQSQRKEFPTDAEAEASHVKLIAEKVKKGYDRDLVSQAPPVVGTVAPTSPQPPRAKPLAQGRGGRPAPEPGHAHTRARTGGAAPAIAASEPPSTARVIDLDPDDWLWATWRPRTSLATARDEAVRPGGMPGSTGQGHAKFTDSELELEQGPIRPDHDARGGPLLARGRLRGHATQRAAGLLRPGAPRKRRNSFDGRPTLQDAIRAVRIIVQNASEPLLAILANSSLPPI